MDNQVILEKPQYVSTPVLCLKHDQPTEMRFLFGDAFDCFICDVCNTHRVIWYDEYYGPPEVDDCWAT